MSSYRGLMTTPLEPPSELQGAAAGASPADRRLALRIVTMPRDTNHYGTIFGGVILSYIDQAGFVEARRHGSHQGGRWVTAAIDRVDFKAPVHLGDTVSFWSRTVRLGTKSVTVEIEVMAERLTGQHAAVTTAVLTLVAVDESGKTVAFCRPSA
jgi:acyl-CoA thioesterase YciA